MNENKVKEFFKWGFSTLSCRCENDEFELVLVKSSRPTSSSVCSKNIIFSIFGKIFKYFPVNFGIKIIAIKFPFLWYYLQYYWSTISVLNWNLNFILVHKSSLVYRLQSRFLSEATAEFQLKSNLHWCASFLYPKSLVSQSVDETLLWARYIKLHVITSKKKSYISSLPGFVSVWLREKKKKEAREIPFSNPSQSLFSRTEWTLVRGVAFEVFF